MGIGRGSWSVEGLKEGMLSTKVDFASSICSADSNAQVINIPDSFAGC